MLLHSLGTQNRRDSTPLVNLFQHPEPITTLVGSPQSRNLFQISGLATGRKAPYGITGVGLGSLAGPHVLCYSWSLGGCFLPAYCLTVGA